MNSLVVYDSAFGNTAKIAAAVAAELGRFGPCRLVKVTEVTPSEIAHAELIVLGSPTQAFRPLPSMKDFIESLPAAVVTTREFAVFDTRIAPEDTPSLPLRWAMRIAGFAAEAMQKRLEQREARMAAAPAGFVVTGREGPLRDGEIGRARSWARTLADALAPQARAPAA